MVLHNIQKVIDSNWDKPNLNLNVITDRGKELNIIFRFLADNIIRFQLMPENKIEEVSMVVNQIPEAEDLNFHEEVEKIVVETDKLEVRINKYPFLYSVNNKDGEALWQQSSNDLNVGLQPVGPRFGFEYDEKQNEVEKITDSFALDIDEKIVGFGGKFTPINKRGDYIESWDCDAYGVQTDRAYINIPFFMSSRGFGIFYDTTTRLRHWPGDSPRSLYSYIFEVYDRCLDYYFIYGPSYKNVLKKYTKLTGKPEIPPKWSLGIWMSRCYYETRHQVEDIADKLRTEKYPCDVINLDGRAWLRHGKQTDFVWDRERYPQPEEMITDLRQKGYKVCLWENPYISEESELFAEAKENEYLLTREDGSVYKINWVPSKFTGLHCPPPSGIVDLTNPDAYQWFKNLHRDNLKWGINIYKTDFGEEIPEDAVSYSGLTGRHLHNLYPLLYNKAVYSTIREEVGEDGLVWARSGWAGSQKFPIQWGGDSQASYEGLAGALRGILNAGFSGLPFFSHDIGGFYGEKPDSRLYIRWLQFGLLSSHARFHGTTPREPWEFGEKAVENYKKYARLRYRLIPYLYSYSLEARETSLPLMRALPLEYQEDPLAYQRDFEYLLGEELLVAPIYNNKDTRNIYIPEGTWIDYWTGEKYTGRQLIEYNADIDTIPLFIKDGSIIPFGPEMNYIGERETNPLEVKVYPDTAGEFTLYEDSGKTSLNYEVQSDNIYFNIDGVERDYLLNILKPDVERIFMDGRELPELEKLPADYKQAGYLLKDNSLLVVLPSISRTELDIYTKGGINIDGDKSWSGFYLSG